MLKAMEVIPHVGFAQAYGQTEASPVITLLGPEYHTITGPFAGKLKAAGKVIPGTDLAIMDEQGNSLPMPVKWVKSASEVTTSCWVIGTSQD